MARVLIAGCGHVGTELGVRLQMCGLETSATVSSSMPLTVIGMSYRQCHLVTMGHWLQSGN
jgi:uncharacterized membrane protein YhiD involved in acid resistance